MDASKEPNTGSYRCMSLPMDSGRCDSWDGVAESRLLMSYQNAL